MASTEELQKKIDDLTSELKKYKKVEKQVQDNLALMQQADESMNARDWETLLRGGPGERGSPALPSSSPPNPL